MIPPSPFVYVMFVVLFVLGFVMGFSVAKELDK